MRRAPSVRVKPQYAERTTAKFRVPAMATLLFCYPPDIERACDFRGQLDEAMRVAHLIVIPGEDLYRRPVDDHRREGVDNARSGVVEIVDRDERALLVAENPLETSLCGRLAELVYLLDGGLPFHLEDAIGQRRIEQRDPDRKPVQLALKLGVDESDCRRRAGGGRSERHQR